MMLKESDEMMQHLLWCQIHGSVAGGQRGRMCPSTQTDLSGGVR